MKKQIFSLMAAMAMLTAGAQTFEADGIFYSPLPSSPGTCEVTYSGGQAYTGDIEIPASVSDGTTVYSVTAIGDYAFAGCGEISSIILPESVLYVGRNAFQGCSALAEITFPDAVESIEEQTFYGCYSLSSFRGNGVRMIGASGFSNCRELSSVALSDNLEYIGDSGFKNCASLTAFTVSDGMELGIAVFSGCTGLVSVSLPAGLRVIPEYTFSECTSLGRIAGTDNLEEIGDFAFYACSSLTDFSFGPSLSRIGKNAFGLCSDLDIRLISGHDAVIDDYAFTGCTSLTDLALEGFYEIGEEAFANAGQLRHISLDPTIHVIGERAFRGCEALEMVECYSDQPPFLANSSFTQTTYETAILKVPFGRKLLYTQTPPWSYFRKVEEAEDAGLGNHDVASDNFSVKCNGTSVTVRGREGTVEIYSLSGRKLVAARKDCEDIEIALPEDGVCVVCLNGRSATVIAKR